MKQLLLYMGLAVAMFGQASDSNSTFRTSGALNGRFWKSLDLNGKQTFVIGYVEAATNVMLATCGNPEPCLVTKMVFLPTGLTYAEITSAIDRFFIAPENGPISITGAIQVISQRSIGVDEEAIRKFMLGLRSQVMLRK